MNNHHPKKDGLTSADDVSDKAARHIREDIAKTRNDMSGTIDELHGKLNPSVLKEQAMDQFHEAKKSIKAELTAEFHEAKNALKAELIDVKSSIKTEVKAELDDAKAIFKHELSEAKAAVREATIGKVENMVHGAEETVMKTGNSIIETVKANPIPAALAGVGLAWLFLNMRASSRVTRQGSQDGRAIREIGVRGYDDARGPLDRVMRQVGEKAGQAVHSVQHSASNVVRQAGDLAQKAQTSTIELTHTAQESVSHFAHDAQASVSQLAQHAQSQARRIETRFETTLHDNPLAIGAAVLALGTAMGLAFPTTRREDEWMGAARDQVLGRAEELAHGAIETVEEAVKHLGEDMTKPMKAGNGTTTQPVRT